MVLCRLFYDYHRKIPILPAMIVNIFYFLWIRGIFIAQDAEKNTNVHVPHMFIMENEVTIKF